jgi:uncharacterized ion transporter superfamily protein YfcC
MSSLKIINGISLVIVWSLIFIVALIVMITWYIVGGAYEKFIRNKSKVSRLRIGGRDAGSNKHQRGSPFL